MRSSPRCERTRAPMRPLPPCVSCTGPSSAARVLLVHCQCEECGRGPEAVATLDAFCAHASGAAPEAGTEEVGDGGGEEDDTAVDARCRSTLSVLVGGARVGVHARGLHPVVCGDSAGCPHLFSCQGVACVQPGVRGGCGGLWGEGGMTRA